MCFFAPLLVSVWLALEVSFQLSGFVHCMGFGSVTSSKWGIDVSIGGVDLCKPGFQSCSVKRFGL